MSTQVAGGATVAADTPHGGPGPPCPSAFADANVFVLGTRRSGTTWLSELLLAHPDVTGADAAEPEPGEYVPQESVMFGGMADVWVNASRTDGEGVAAYLSPVGVAGALRAFCDRIFAAGRARYGPRARHFIEKSPDNSKRLPLMAASHPDAWYVHIIRDGRDVARSLASVHFGPGDLAESAAEWVRDVRLVREHQWRLFRYREVRYEDLVVDPVGHAGDLLRWVGLDVDADVTRRLSERAAKEVARYGSTAPSGAGKWRLLGPAEVATVLDVAGDLLGELGYLDPAGPQGAG